MRSPVMRRRSSMSETRSFFIESQRKKLTPFLEAILAPRLQLVCCRATVENDPSADDSVLDLRITDRLRRYFRQISIDDDDVRELPRSERSFLLFLEGGVSGAGSVGSQRILDAYLLRGNPAVGVFVVESPPRDRRVNPLERSRRRHRPVATKRETGVRVLERTKCVRRLRSLRTDDFLGPAPVVDRVIRLHARYDAEPPEAGDV